MTYFRGFSTAVATVVLVVLGGCCGGGHGVVDVPTEELGICSSAVTIHGYKCQEIQVQTKDGYILSVQRILEGRYGSDNGVKKQPVIIQHGVLVDGMTWLLNSPEQNLPLILADKGYDVWIANTRGTRFSRHHTSLDPSSPAFWDWSWDELVTYDLPAVFDHVSQETGHKIHYIGHSLGTLILIASLAEGKLVEQLQSVAFLSPIAYLSHMTTVIGAVAARSLLPQVVTKALGVEEFNPKGKAVGNFLKSLCFRPRVNCYDLLSAFTGKNCCLNSSTVELFLKNEPQSTSTKNMVHLSQIVQYGVLAKFNYGRMDYNLRHYGRINPPLYDLSKIPRDIPIFISYGGRDALSDLRDVGHLLEILKSHDVDKLTVQYVENYAHADFIMGINANDNVYKYVTAFITKHGSV
ncbi:triacylglycerol lipase 2-like [Cucurbita moschata]|uniref:Lipase n=1 Tax=Cucurbita moschata TaxID=3662 RepID=A0A6J1EKH0_CUCMO|nr:triacylglycerol lipase 2-like [Cucurbita moschata]XP_022928315.1 triacylglycerol lipase 2-like [Cucurbita moschata]